MTKGPATKAPKRQFRRGRHLSLDRSLFKQIQGNRKSAWATWVFLILFVATIAVPKQYSSLDVSKIQKISKNGFRRRKKCHQNLGVNVNPDPLGGILGTPRDPVLWSHITFPFPSQTKGMLVYLGISSLVMSGNLVPNIHRSMDGKWMVNGW